MCHADTKLHKGIWIMTEKAQNKNLNKAKTNKKDEFYTQLSDIERELKYYKQGNTP